MYEYSHSFRHGQDAREHLGSISKLCVNTSRYVQLHEPT